MEALCEDFGNPLWASCMKAIQPCFWPNMYKQHVNIFY
jgi:hypothetical protein